MQRIFVMGAGRSATDLIEYLLEHAVTYDWQVTVGDMSVALAQSKVGNHPRGQAVPFDGAEESEVRQAVASSDIIVSLLPPFMHPKVARACVDLGKHLVTASYISPEMASLHQEAQEKGLIFLNELGADPGIDHLSIMRSVDAIHAKGGKILDLRSYCGSLIAPDSNDNVWGYKFTWSPMNVILAGQGAAQYLKNGKRTFIPYNRLFSTIDTLTIDGIGTFDAYANRDSYSYVKTYGLADIHTLFRGTLRMGGYCEGWNALIKMGLTANDYRIADSDKLTYREWIASYFPVKNEESLEAAVATFLETTCDSALFKRIESTGIFEEKQITRNQATPAEILHDVLAARWVFREEDKDMLVMADKIQYLWEGRYYEKTATMVVIGKDYHHTAISRTVGLPAAMGVKLILTNQIQGRGVLAPITPDIYLPILQELASYGIDFKEETHEIFPNV